MASYSINGMSKITIEHGPVTPTPRVERRYSTDGIASSTEKKEDAKAQENVGQNRADMISRLSQEDDYEVIQSDIDGDILSVTKDGAEQVKSVSKEKDKISGFKGVTNEELETYYLEGRISRTDYIVEMNKREALEDFRSPSYEKKDENEVEEKEWIYLNGRKSELHGPLKMEGVLEDEKKEDFEFPIEKEPLIDIPEENNPTDVFSA
ncbi:MAG: hypothetical protein K5851_08340 [Lachnospiraceae bacterium]|nr:hypothetical protein [Lachnospiraceae bacterium]